MRCLACNRILSDYEATRKYALTNDYVDLCTPCFKPIEHQVNTIERKDLFSEEDFYDELNEVKNNNPDYY